MRDTATHTIWNSKHCGFFLLNRKICVHFGFSIIHNKLSVCFLDLLHFLEICWTIFLAYVNHCCPAEVNGVMMIYTS